MAEGAARRPSEPRRGRPRSPGLTAGPLSRGPRAGAQRDTGHGSPQDAAPRNILRCKVPAVPSTGRCRAASSRGDSEPLLPRDTRAPERPEAAVRCGPRGVRWEPVRARVRVCGCVRACCTEGLVLAPRGATSRRQRHPPGERGGRSGKVGVTPCTPCGGRPADGSPATALALSSESQQRQNGKFWDPGPGQRKRKNATFSEARGRLCCAEA